MKSLLVAGVLVLGLLANLPGARAQALDDVTLKVTSPTTPVPYAGSATFPFEAKVGCKLIGQTFAGGAGSASLMVQAVSPPAWLTVTAEPVAASPSDCLGTSDGYHTYSGTATLAVTSDAPGVVDHVVNLTASLGSGASAAVPMTFTVAYHVAYSLKPDVVFPMKVTKPKTTFNVTITQASNARSMVMIEDIKWTCGLVTGLASEVYESAAGKPATHVYKVTFTAPATTWDKCTVTFTAYGHFLLLDARAGPFDAGTPMKWEFDNGGVQAASSPTASKKSPEPVGPMVGLSLVALAALLRRRE